MVCRRELRGKSGNLALTTKADENRGRSLSRQENELAMNELQVLHSHERRRRTCYTRGVERIPVSLGNFHVTRRSRFLVVPAI
jgi:hypothetical protein